MSGDLALTVSPYVINISTTSLPCNNLDLTTMQETLSWMVCVLGIIGMSSNIFVICTIARDGVFQCHFSKLYYFSLAVADLSVATCSVGYTFMATDVICMHGHPKTKRNIGGAAWIALTSALLHVALITFDRFLATAHPLLHKTLVTRRRVVVVICSVWLFSFILVLSMLWEKRIALWTAVTGVPVGSIGMFATYIHIMRIAVNRSRALRLSTRRRRPSRVSTQSVMVTEVKRSQSIMGDVKNSVNTICLGFTISLTFILCNLPLSILILRYLYTKTINRTFRNINPTEIVVMHFLLTINTVADPFIYTMVAVCNRNSRRKKSASGVSEMVLEAVDHPYPLLMANKGRGDRRISVL